jgi:ribosome-binding factor A
MQDGKRQKQVSALLLEELSGIFQRLGLSMIEGGLISLTAVKVTPDLLEARVYLSLFQVKDAAVVMKKIEDRSWEIKRDLAERVKNQLRRIPILTYFHDDTLDHADRMEALFRKLNEDKPLNQDNALSQAPPLNQEKPPES